VSVVVPVFLGVPLRFAPKAEWVLRTLLAARGAQPEPVYEDERAAECALAYATRPVPGVPTIPASARAHELIAADGALPHGSFALNDTEVGALAGAFAFGDGVDADAPAGDADTASGADAATRDAGATAFAAPFDVIASAFVLLACWDEHTSLERDPHGRFPYEASVFVAEPALDLGEPVVDRYLKLVARLVDEGLTRLGREPLPAVSWETGGEGEGETTAGRFALALTHDVDGLKRWTARGWLAAGKRTAGALRHRNLPKARFEVGAMAHAVTRDIPTGEDPYWTFPQVLRREDDLGVSSTFFLLASHAAVIDGVQPRVYQRRLPRLLRLLRDARREVGLHGNDRDRLDGAALADDRRSLAERAQVPVDGMRYHYLRCLYHETLPLLDAAAFAYDSSLAFAEREGFRCGVSFPFHPYDLKRDRPLDLVELPLAVMDSTLQEKKYRGLDAAGALPAARATLEKVRDGGGGTALLWHLNRFHRYVGLGYGDVYWQLLDWARAEGGTLLPAGELVRRWRARAGETTL